MQQPTDLSPHFNTQKGDVPNAFSLERIKLSDRVFDILVPIMNEIHGVQYSYRFWKMVINEYVNAVVSLSHILQKQEMGGKPSLLAINRHYVPTVKERIMSRLPAVIKHCISPGKLKTVHSILATHNHVSFGLPKMDEVTADTGYTLPLCYPVYPGRGDASKRKKVNNIAARYTDIYLKNIIKRLPQVYVEYFEKDFESILLFEPASKTFHVHGMPPYFNCLLVAKYLEHGAKLFCYQHGAYYGELVGHNSYLYEKSLADEYRTWGWKMNPDDVPWKAYRLEKFKRQYDASSNTVQFDFLMCFPDVYDANIKFYKAGTHYFLQHINKDKYRNLLARPRPANRIFSQTKRLAFIQDSRVTIDSGLGYMANVMRKCQLVVQFSVPATNFLECLYVDHPTIGLLDNDEPTEIIKPYYDFLMRQGVLHKDFVSLVDHLNKINVAEWWGSFIKEPMYLQFKNEFLRKV
jgi:hypothetical protein